MGKKHWRVYLGLVGVLVALKYATMDLVFSLPNWLQDFFILAISVLIEATPFVILGVLISALVKHYVPDKWFFKALPNNAFLRRMYVSLLGTFLPVCECGNLPLARGLMVKGLKPSDTLAFLLSAPIMNPITITTTIIAFGYDKNIVIARIAGGFVIANFVSWMFSSKNENKLLTADFAKQCEAGLSVTKGKRKLGAMLKDFTHEIESMVPPLVLGSVVAGLSQVLIPRSVLTELGSHVVLSIIAMMVLAFVISICANVDAFFALSYAGVFTPGSIVAFLVFGPMIDIKMLSLMRTTYTKAALLRITIFVALCSFLLGLVVNYAF